MVLDVPHAEERIAADAGVLYAHWHRDSAAAEGDIALAELLAERFEDVQAEFVEWRDGFASAVRGASSLSVAMSGHVPAAGAYWWASTIASTPLEMLGRVADVLKLRLLEREVEGRDVASVRYQGWDGALASTLGAWARSRNWVFEWTRPASGERAPDASPRTASGLPHPVRALRYLASFMKRRTAIRPLRAVTPATRNPELVIATYFPNIDDGARRETRFRSRYWGAFHTLIEEARLPVRWLWFFTDSSQMSIAEAAAFRDALNARSAQTGESFEFLEERFSVRSLIVALRIYLKLVWAGVRFGAVRHRFRLHGSAIDFRPLMRDEWASSTRGAHAMFVALYSASCRAALAGLPRSADRLLYLWEGQPWEYLLLDAWQGDRRAATVGVAHSPACAAPMLLRNRMSPPRLEMLRALGPHSLAVTGGAAARAFEQFGWPARTVSVSEALRYQHLPAVQSPVRAVPAAGRVLLVITGIQRTETERQLRLLERAAVLGALASYARILVKAHPFCPVDSLLSSLAFPLPVTIVSDAIETLAADAHVAFVAGESSASIDTAWLGLPTVVLGGNAGLTLCPYPSARTVSLVATAATLSAALASPESTHLDADCFAIDRHLPRWRRLLDVPPAVIGGVHATCTS